MENHQKYNGMILLWPYMRFLEGFHATGKGEFAVAKRLRRAILDGTIKILRGFEDDHKAN